MKTVSVVIPFKGEIAASQLSACVLSLMDQTIKPLEIILVGTRNGLKDSKNPNFLRRKNLVFVEFTGDKNAARNAGIIKARGDYILYLDHDMRADKKLISDCSKVAEQHGAVIIPEKSNGSSFWGKCKKLERELITYDLYTVTPRFYKKDIFKKGEKPFDSNFGLLDEWGFNNKLMKKKISLGYSKSSLLIEDESFNLITEIVKKFNRGLWMKNFRSRDKDEAWRRINPIKRGLLFYGSKINYLFRDPAHFLGLLFLKLVHFSSFMGGYIIGFLLNFDVKNSEGDLIKHYDQLGVDYLKKSYLTNGWTRYVDTKEKIIVSRFLNKLGSDFNKENILDLGMGPGRWSKYFVGLSFKHVFGLDISPRMVSDAKKVVKDKRFKGYVGRMEEMPFKNNQFDKVFCFRAIKYTNNTDKVIEESFRVLKNHGTFILEVSNNSLVNRLLKTVSGIIVLINGRYNYQNSCGYFYKANFFTKEEIINKLLNNKFKIVLAEPLFILPSVPLPTWEGKIVWIWKIIDNLLFTTLPKNWFCRSWIFLAEKK